VLETADPGSRTEPRGRRLDHAGYGAGALASGCFATVPGLILLYYLTDTLAIPAAVAALVVLLPKLFDIFLNPVVGRLSDRTRSRFGARRPWIFVGGLLFPVAFIATFSTPFSGDAAAVWVATAFTLAGISFAAYVVPWSSLPAEIAADSRSRTSMAAWRIAFVAIAILLAGGLAPTLVEIGGGGRPGYRLMALTIGGIMIAATLTVTFVGARRSTPTTTRPAAAAGFRAVVDLLLSSPPLRAMFWLVCLTEIASAVSLAGTPYLATYVIGDEDVVAPMFLLLTLPLLVTMPIWRAVAIRRGKRSALRIALTINAVGTLTLSSLWFAPEHLRHVVAFTAMFIGGVGFAGTAMLPQAMFADALAYATAQHDESSTGAVVGAWNAVEAISGSLGAALFAVALTATGFISSNGAGQVVQQPDLAIAGIAFAASLIPAAAVLLALAPVRSFTLTEGEVDRATTEAAHET